MFANAQEQLFIFIMCGVCGMCLGLFYDLFKMCRRLVKPSNAAVGIQDAVFWIISAGCVFVFLLIIDDGRIRFYELSAIFTVWLLYQLTISKYIVQTGVFIIQKLCYVLLLPLRLICRLCRKPVFFAVSISRKSFKRAGRILAGSGRKWRDYTKNFKKMRKKI